MNNVQVKGVDVEVGVVLRDGERPAEASHCDFPKALEACPLAVRTKAASNFRAWQVLQGKG